MRWRFIAVAGVLGAVSVLVVACGLEKGGLLSDPGDATIPDSGGDTVVWFDVAIPDIFVPPACTTLDASCLPPYPADAGWRPIVVPNDGGCPVDPDAGWVPSTFQTDAALVPGSCTACSCTATSSGPCPMDATVSFYGGSDFNCNGGSSSAVVSATDNCQDLSKGGGRVVLKYPAQPTSTCEAGGGGNAQVTSDPVTVCATSSCTTDYCGLKSNGYSLCIFADTVDGAAPACPSGYTTLVAGKTVGGSCGTCGCKTSPQTCSAILTTYSANGCDTLRDTFDAAPCRTYQSFSSLKLTVAQVDAACTATTSGAGFGLVAPVAICCAP